MEVQSLSMRTIINYGTFQPILFLGAYCFLKVVQPDVGGDYRGDGIEVSYRWFGTKAKAEAFAMNKLATSVDLNTKAVEQMVSLLRKYGGR